MNKFLAWLKGEKTQYELKSSAVTEPVNTSIYLPRKYGPDIQFFGRLIYSGEFQDKNSGYGRMSYMFRVYRSTNGCWIFDIAGDVSYWVIMTPGHFQNFINSTPIPYDKVKKEFSKHKELDELVVERI